VRKAPCIGNFTAPNLLIEMDGNIIVNVEVNFHVLIINNLKNKLSNPPLNALKKI